MELIEYRSITKRFGGTTALDGVSFSIREGECHALMGENGAGKSTAGKILAGILRPDSGELCVGGIPRKFHSARDAHAAGIGMVHQEPAYAPDLSITENLMLGQMPRRFGVFVDAAAAMARARALLHEVAPELDPSVPMRSLTIAQHQLVQIAAALGTGAGILVLDEPTSSLAEAESQRLFGLMAELRRCGVTTIYVSHRMPEVFAIADRISVLRDGRLIGTVERADADQDRLIEMMIGRPVESGAAIPAAVHTGARVLDVENLSSPGRFERISFSVGEGEIVGIAGLVGAGRSECAQAVFGLDPHARGRVVIGGRDCSRAPVRARMEAGLAFVPEDRKRQGLAPELSCRKNFSLAVLRRVSTGFMVRRGRETGMMRTLFEALRVKTASFEADVASLSGGNQQKVLLARWLARGARAVILDEPTRGVDIGAKMTIHETIRDLARKGTAVLLISSELPELLALSSRILIMREGRLVGAMERSEAAQDSLLRAMTGL